MSANSERTQVRSRITVTHGAGPDPIEIHRGVAVTHPHPRHWHEEFHACAITGGGGKSVVLAELKDNVIVPPDISFDHDFNIDLGNREVQLKWLGRGNTRGDIVIYLPKENIIAVGDLLDSPVPYLGGGYPVEEIETLKRISDTNPKTIIPGHGDALHDKVLLTDVIDFLQTVTSEVSKQVYIVGNGPRNLDEVRKNVLAALDVKKWDDKLAGPNQQDRTFSKASVWLE